MHIYLITSLKLLLALLLSAFIGFEREHTGRPAGLRTHVLVCLGSTLIQITAVNFYTNSSGAFTGDPMRLGAQVISGIGIICAGTILKEGATITGLTTATTLWCTGCIGLAVGSGLYIESIIAALFVFCALKGLKRIELKLSSSRTYASIKIVIADEPGCIGQIGSILGNQNINIKSIEIQPFQNNLVSAIFSIKLNANIDKASVLGSLMAVKGIQSSMFL